MEKRATAIQIAVAISRLLNKLNILVPIIAAIRPSRASFKEAEAYYRQLTHV